jgi:hypothetical protein
MGSDLAVVTYVILRAGLISTPSESGATPDINDFGVAGISALVGLMTDEIMQKLKHVFNSIFGTEKMKSGNRLVPDIIYYSKNGFEGLNRPFRR